MVGKTLAGRYELLEKIGEGGMARVYRGRDHYLRRTVAVKILKDQMTGDTEFVRRFRREAQAAAGLSHPNIVNIYDVGEEDSTYYIVMEYVDGKNLKQHIREKGRLPEHESVKIARQITEALVQAHAAGVIHRDIKPQNILFSREGQVKVVDFGIALAADGSTLTCSDNIVGSVHYFSPEQARGNLAGKQSDLYSLGIILYEMVTGQVPFSGESPVSIAMKHVQESIIPPRRLVIDISEPLERVILKAVQKEPTSRYSSAREFLEDLTLFQHKGAARAVPGAEQVDDDEDTKVMKPVGNGTGVRGKGKRALTRQAWFIPLLVLLFLSSALTVGFIYFRDQIFVPEVTVPDVRDLSQAEAVQILTAEGLTTNPTVKFIYDDSIPTGYVVRTDPYYGRTVRKNRAVELYISMGPEYLVAPDLYKRTESEARIVLQQMELEVKVEREHNDDVEEGRIFKQFPAEGTSLSRGEEVIIYVSLGGRPFPISNLVGLTRDEALEYLDEEGLRSRLRYESADTPAGTVAVQIPEPGENVSRGQTVDLVISTGNGEAGDSDSGETGDADSGDPADDNDDD